MLTYYSGLCVCVWTITVSMNLIICNDDDDSDDDDYIGCNMYSSHEETHFHSHSIYLKLTKRRHKFLMHEQSTHKKIILNIHSYYKMMRNRSAAVEKRARLIIYQV